MKKMAILVVTLVLALITPPLAPAMGFGEEPIVIEIGAPYIAIISQPRPDAVNIRVPLNLELLENRNYKYTIKARLEVLEKWLEWRTPETEWPIEGADNAEEIIQNQPALCPNGKTPKKDENGEIYFEINSSEFPPDGKRLILFFENVKLPFHRQKEIRLVLLPHETLPIESRYIKNEFTILSRSAQVGISSKNSSNQVKFFHGGATFGFQAVSLEKEETRIPVNVLIRPTQGVNKWSKIKKDILSTSFDPNKPFTPQWILVDQYMGKPLEIHSEVEVIIIFQDDEKNYAKNLIYWRTTFKVTGKPKSEINITGQWGDFSQDDDWLEVSGAIRFEFDDYQKFSKIAPICVIVSVKEVPDPFFDYTTDSWKQMKLAFLMNLVPNPSNTYPATDNNNPYDYIQVPFHIPIYMLPIPKDPRKILLARVLAYGKDGEFFCASNKIGSPRQKKLVYDKFNPLHFTFDSLDIGKQDDGSFSRRAMLQTWGLDGADEATVEITMRSEKTGQRIVTEDVISARTPDRLIYFASSAPFDQLCFVTIKITARGKNTTYEIKGFLPSVEEICGY